MIFASRKMLVNSHSKCDKLDFESSYDVYGGFARSPNLTFGANEKVQDEFGNNFVQWPPAVAANGGGRVAVVWDDDRDGSSDVWLSWRNADGWSDDLAVPGAIYKNLTNQDSTDGDTYQKVLVGGSNGEAIYDTAQKRVIVTFQGHSTYAKRYLG